MSPFHSGCFGLTLSETVAGMLPLDKLLLSQSEVVSAPANQPGTQRE